MYLFSEGSNYIVSSNSACTGLISQLTYFLDENTEEEYSREKRIHEKEKEDNKSVLFDCY